MEIIPYGKQFIDQNDKKLVIKSLSEDGNRECDHLDETKDFIVTLLEKERSKIPKDSKLFLGGFSQGGAVSLYTGLQSPETAP